MDGTLSSLHDFGVQNGIRFFLVPTKLMLFLLLCHHDVSLLFRNSWFVLFLLFCAFFVMTTHKIEVQVMISVKLRSLLFSAVFWAVPCWSSRSTIQELDDECALSGSQMRKKCSNFIVFEALLMKNNKNRTCLKSPFSRLVFS
jgi:hypothetical protein